MIQNFTLKSSFKLPIRISFLNSGWLKWRQRDLDNLVRMKKSLMSKHESKVLDPSNHKWPRFEFLLNFSGHIFDLFIFNESKRIERMFSFSGIIGAIYFAADFSGFYLIHSSTSLFSGAFIW